MIFIFREVRCQKLGFLIYFFRRYKDRGVVPRLSREAEQAPPFAKGGAGNIYMFFVYLLKSEKDGKFYIGQTEDVRARFLEHQNGLVESTKYRRPFVLVYYEAYLTREKAIEREKKLKQFGSSYTGLLKRIGYK